MSDTTTQAPEDVEAERAIARFEEVADQLRDPHAILANALLRIHQADDAQAELDALDDTEAFGWQSTRIGERQQFLVESAKALTEIARFAADLADRERANHDPLGSALTDFYADEAVTVYLPQAVQGTRFEAVLSPADGFHIGRVGNREWLYLPGHGFVDITNADETSHIDVNLYTLRGRIVSETPDHILGITDGGIGVTLPRALISESPEDRR